MKVLPATIAGALAPLLPAAAVAQSPNMMSGGDWGGAMGGFGGAWVPALVTLALIVLVVLVITQRRK